MTVVERRPTRDLSVKHFLREAFAAITDVDSVLISTFRTLFTKPGELSVEYLHGDRYRYLPPFRVFLLCNIVYFLFATSFGSTILTAPLENQVGSMVYREATLPVLEHRYHLKPRAAGESYSSAVERLPPDLVRRYDGATQGLGKTIVVLLIPLYAMVLAILYAGTRRYLAEHLVFATHFVAVFLVAIPAAILAMAGYIAIVMLVLGRRGMVMGENLLGAGTVSLIGVYAYLAQREFYQSRPIPTLLRTAVLGASIIPVVIAFKFLLFFATMYWIGR